jgi:hypothetical protein
LSPGHLLFYCPHYTGETPTSLTWKDEGFYRALALWENNKDDAYAAQCREEEVLYLEECMKGGSDDLGYSDDPVYHANQDD